MYSTHTVKIGAANGRAYDVHIGGGIMSKTAEYVAPLIKSNAKIAIVTDSVVDGLYSGEVERSFRSLGFEVEKFVFEAGERSKTSATYLRAIDFLAEHAFTRSDVVVAVGGGVTGDLGGFVAATYMRGISYVQVPTTLLAMTDSSVGGKTGIDISAGKNLVGAFHRPIAVIADVCALSTLPREQFVSGMGEVIKYACLDGGRIAQIVEDGVTEDNISELVALAVESKARVVDADEKESGMRRLLNLGHTAGHAIEKLSDYTVPHGIAVAKGLYGIAVAAARRGECPAKDVERLGRMLEAYDIDPAIDYTTTDIVECAAHDKKSDGDIIHLAIMHGFGDCRIRAVGKNHLQEYLL